VLLLGASLLVMDLPHLRNIGLNMVECSHFTAWRAASLAAGSVGHPAAMPVPERELQPVSLETAAPAAPSRPAPMERAAVHGELISEALAAKIPESDVTVLSFLLDFLSAEGLGYVPVFINGGYVRDLLLGKEPDDLDLSLCLRDCPEDITVMGLLEKLPDFLSSNKASGIKEVKLATILSNESKEKNVDTFKAHFTNSNGQRIEVDVMPTIGEEKYEEGSRIPVRDQRGTPEEDALRRDLTIGALLLSVQREGTGSRLCYRLLDFYGGVEDIRQGVLRAPFPAHLDLPQVRAIVVRSAAEEEMAASLGTAAESKQVLWWAKILMDDPLRACRALRFAAKFRSRQFQLHEAFWSALPFALQALGSKVAGSRKNTEYLKIGDYGFAACTEFFELAFTRTFGPGASMRLAEAVFGGQDGKGRAKSLSKVLAFDLDLFRALAAPMAAATEANELMGGLLAAAIFSCRFDGADGAEAEFMRACDGMCVSNSMRDAGIFPLSASSRWVTPPSAPNSLDVGFAAVCSGVSAEDLRLHTQVWEDLQLPGSKARPPWAQHRRLLTLGFVRGFGAHARAEAVERCLEVVAQERPPVKGSVLSLPGLLEVPPMLRRQVMSLLEVTLRLLQYAGPLEDAEHLTQLFAAHPALQEALSSSVWYESDGKTLRPEFAPPKKGKEKDGKKK